MRVNQAVDLLCDIQPHGCQVVVPLDSKLLELLTIELIDLLHLCCMLLLQILLDCLLSMLAHLLDVVNLLLGYWVVLSLSFCDSNLVEVLNQGTHIMDLLRRGLLSLSWRFFFLVDLKLLILTFIISIVRRYLFLHQVVVWFHGVFIGNLAKSFLHVVVLVDLNRFRDGHLRRLVVRPDHDVYLLDLLSNRRALQIRHFKYNDYISII